MRERGYLDGLDAETFDLDAHLAAQDPRLLADPEGRRLVTRHDPLLFGWVYLRHHLRSADGDITFGDVHLGLYRDALHLVTIPGPKEDRRAYVAPRGSGKSTTLFLITSLWAAAHGHVHFIAAFSSSATQAQDHLAGLRREFHTNPLLRLDYPDLCAPARKANGTPVADSHAMVHTVSRFSFAARGIDTEVLGLVDPENRRPDLLLLDDVEGDEGAGYSQYQADQRLATIIDGILPMNDRAHVRLVGTATRAGGIMHQLAKTVLAPGEPPADWIREEQFRTTYFAPLVARPDGSERSLWPGRWSTEFLQSIRTTRGYAKTFLNDPVQAGGTYWSKADFTYGDMPCAFTVLSIDGAVTTKKASDYTGLAVVGATAHKPADPQRRCLVKDVAAVKLTGEALRAKVLELLALHPEIALVLVEANQGGDLWHQTLHDLPVKIRTFTNSEPKEIRAGRLHALYQRIPSRVVHARRLPAYEEQAVAFPHGAHDDMVDAVGNAVLKLITTAPPRRPVARSVSYV